jgi:hypothetical protein
MVSKVKKNIVYSFVNLRDAEMRGGQQAVPGEANASGLKKYGISFFSAGCL